MKPYPEPGFTEPFTDFFGYVAWSVDPVRTGPFVRSSAPRRRRIEEITAIAARAAQRSEVISVRVFEATFIPPLRSMPKYDVVLLARAATRDVATDIIHDSHLSNTKPAVRFLAANAARFGLTDNGDPRADILLNHFTGQAARPSAVRAWRTISAWFVAKTGIDNSTLLQTEDSAPFLLVNYARLPTGVVGFLLNQLLRPSFHRYVRGILTGNHLTSLPLFVRPVANGSAHG
jgi:hypothetical protein